MSLVALALTIYIYSTTIRTFFAEKMEKARLRTSPMEKQTHKKKNIGNSIAHFFLVVCAFPLKLTR